MEPSLTDIARMTADVVVVQNYGPEAEVRELTIDVVELDRTIHVDQDDRGVYALTPVENFRVSARCRVHEPAQLVNIAISKVPLR